jgi:hypothetical protein
MYFYTLLLVTYQVTYIANLEKLVDIPSLPPKVLVHKLNVSFVESSKCTCIPFSHYLKRNNVDYRF